MQRGSLLTVRERDDGRAEDDTALAAPPPPPVSDAVTHERFNLHASVHIQGDDDRGGERLCRYLCRPAFSLSRLRVRADGNVSYRVKKVSRGRVTERVMTPLETLARLAAIVPPPRYPLLRFHGVVAARHRRRARVVPRPPTPACCNRSKTLEIRRAEATVVEPRPPPRTPAPLEERDGRAAFVVAAPTVVTATLTTTGAAKLVAPHVLSMAHWDRLLDGELYAPSARPDWRTLLKGTFDVDLRVCLRCGGSLTVRAVLTEPASVAKMLAALRRPALLLAPLRAPDEAPRDPSRHGPPAPRAWPTWPAFQSRRNAATLGSPPGRPPQVVSRASSPWTPYSLLARLESDERLVDLLSGSDRPYRSIVPSSGSFIEALRTGSGG